MVMLAENSLSWSNFFYHHAAILTVALNTPAKSEHSQACIFLIWGMHRREYWAKRSRHESAWNKISASYYTFSQLSLFTQGDVYSPDPVNLTVSINATLQLPSPNVAAETQLLLFVQRCTRSGCPSGLFFITAAIQAHPSVLSEKPKSYLRSACGRGYCVTASGIRNDIRHYII